MRRDAWEMSESNVKDVTRSVMDWHGLVETGQRNNTRQMESRRIETDKNREDRKRRRMDW